MTVLQAKELTVQQNGQTILNNVSLDIHHGEQWAITGPSGSGKTTLLNALVGRQHFTGKVLIHENNPALSKKIVLAGQQHHFKNLSNTSHFYYQQRFNSQDSADAITVEADLQNVLLKNKKATDLLPALAALFNIEKLYSEPLIQLSNGENKRLQIVKALLLQPAFLLLDNPFIGLDVQSRQTLDDVLYQVSQGGVHIIIVTSSGHLPFFITNVLSLSGDGSYEVQSINPAGDKAMYQKQNPVLSVDHGLLQSLTVNHIYDFEYAVQMHDVNIVYNKKILDNINWQVKNGERWSLSGPNGSGKSTLLSLVNADNPQAYANDIYLFDRKRGTGESIWDIKKKTGFVSPELHLHFDRATNAFDVVASGLFDTIGLFRKISGQQSKLVTKWMQLLQIERLKQRLLFQLSNSEQRLVLLARALVKNPPLLILDEPCQGLDEEQTAFFKATINEICIAGNKTLIYVSHYEHEIPDCVSKFIRLENGRIS